VIVALLRLSSGAALSAAQPARCTQLCPAAGGPPVLDWTGQAADRRRERQPARDHARTG